jgi:hypothetical protein
MAVMWFNIPRIVNVPWEATEHYQNTERLVIDSCDKRKLLLKSPIPEPGWVTSSHSRDGKHWPFNEFTNGAKPAWIWKAQSDE